MTLALHTPQLSLLFPSWISSSVHISLLQTDGHISFSGVWKTKQNQTNTKQEQLRQIEPWLKRIWGLSSVMDGDLKTAAVTTNQTFGSSWGRWVLFFHPREMRVSARRSSHPHPPFPILLSYSHPGSVSLIWSTQIYFFFSGGWDSRFSPQQLFMPLNCIMY